MEHKIFFTSDTHFSQQRTLELSRRPFINIDEMDDELIKRWNEQVGDNDFVYHLGDFGNPDKIIQLNGDGIYLLKSKDYDVDIKFDDDRVNVLESGTRIKLEDKEFIMIHAPEDGYEYEDDSNLFYLFGHIHKAQMIKRNGINVGVDCHNFTPIDIETILFYRNAIENHYDENVFMDTI